jgi:ATP/maltotriose-dependent transcriptional regulator MalT
VTTRETSGETAARGPGEMPLAEAKLVPPFQRNGIVERPRINAALDAGRGAALTLVSAPAGYGKTTAVRAWAGERRPALAWVTLDPGDNDPVRLWRYVATAVERVRPDLGGRALRRLDSGDGPVEAAIDELMRAIAVFEGDFALVLDDVQAVTDAEALESVAYALRRVPANARVVAITRTDPAVGLERLRAGGELVELRAPDLAFTADEAREFLVDRNGVDLAADEVATLHRRTEGWPAALFLSVLWLRGVADRPRAVGDFRGDHRFVVDYLSREAIAALAPEERSFLLRVAILGRFTPELADTVLGRSDSAAIVASLERRNLFVHRLERGGWYRVHALFAEFAALQLAEDDPGAVAAIHRRAALWLRARGLAVEAVEHGAAAGDNALVSEILVEYHLPLIRSGGARTLLRWVQRLPDEEVVAHPVLAVSAATAATMLGRTLERRRLLHLADRAEATHPERYGPYVQAAAAMVRAGAIDGDVSQAVMDGRRAVAIARAHADPVLVGALAGHARALYLAGDIDAAWAAALEAIEHPEAPRRAPGHAFARATLALVEVDRGRLEAARVHAEKAKELVGGVGNSRSWLGANASVALGVVLAAEGNHAEAERELATAERFFHGEVPTLQHAWLLAHLARARSQRGRPDAAEVTIAAARSELGALGDGGGVPALVARVAREITEEQRRASRGEVLDPPSTAELAVLRLLASDLSVRQIAERLFLSPNTVRTHTRAIYRKLAVNTRADAVARARSLELLAQSESPG